MDLNLLLENITVVYRRFNNQLVRLGILPKALKRRNIMIKSSYYSGGVTHAVLKTFMRETSIPEEPADETDYNKPFKDRVNALRAQSTQLSPSIIEGTFSEDHSVWDSKSETEKRRIQLMLMAKDVVEWLVCEPIGSNDQQVSKMEHDVLSYIAERQANGATDHDILVAWNYISTTLAGVVGREFDVKVLN